MLTENKVLRRFFYATRLGGIIREFFRYLIFTVTKREEKNAESTGDVFAIVNDVRLVSGYNIFPMFGTLLSLVRDGEIIRADDFDFAFVGGHEDIVGLLDVFGCRGFELIGVSVVGREVYEISFVYRTIRVDIFRLVDSVDGVGHVCPNFRTSLPVIMEYGGAYVHKYDNYFKVDYGGIETCAGVILPMPTRECAVMIFERHYGVDWKVPKNRDFIDYEFYEFVEGECFILHGRSEDIVGWINEKL
ncbi:hypothetical protein ACH42_01180 [Endozoicomonas sp. (ex Bugula neritina AB1)]|nr:hypothetical protein ACH42_01180 [Endozoicomonas sp. (ex Bugula neritina AB1)]